MIDFQAERDMRARYDRACWSAKPAEKDMKTRLAEIDLGARYDKAYWSARPAEKDMKARDKA